MLLGAAGSWFTRPGYARAVARNEIDPVWSGDPAHRYEGFGLATNAAAAVRNPAKLLPRALHASVTIMIVIYQAASITVSGNLSDHEIAQSRDYALARAAEPFRGELGFRSIAVAALLFTASAINATLLGAANVRLWVLVVLAFNTRQQPPHAFAALVVFAAGSFAGEWAYRCWTGRATIERSIRECFDSATSGTTDVPARLASRPHCRAQSDGMRAAAHPAHAQRGHRDRSEPTPRLIRELGRHRVAQLGLQPFHGLVCCGHVAGRSAAGAGRKSGADRRAARRGKVKYQWTDCERAYIARRYDRIAGLIGLIDWLFFVPPQFRRRAAQRLALSSGDRVLEIGCGTGRNFPYLREAVGSQGRIYGVDLSAGMLAGARALCERNRWSNVVMVQADAGEYSAPEPLDGVIFGLSYNTIPHHRAVLQHALRQLRPGGRIVIMDGKLPPGRGGRLLLPFSLWLMRATMLGNPLIQPWKNLAPLVDHFEMEEFVFGSWYICWGAKPAAAELAEPLRLKTVQ